MQSKHVWVYFYLEHFSRYVTAAVGTLDSKLFLIILFTVRHTISETREVHYIIRVQAKNLNYTMYVHIN